MELHWKLKILLTKNSNTKTTQSFDCSSSKNYADVNSRGFQENTVERQKEEPGQVSFFSNNATRIVTFQDYKPSEHIGTVLRTVRNLISCRNFIRNPYINSISKLATISFTSTLRTIKKHSNRIRIQEPINSIFEACDSLQDYSAASTGNITTVIDSKMFRKILAPIFVLCSMP